MTVLARPQPHITSEHHLEGKMTGKGMEQEPLSEQANHLGRIAQLKRIFEMPASKDGMQDSLQHTPKDFSPAFVKHNRRENPNIFNLDFSSYLSYYNILRTSQYLAQALTPLGVALIAGGFFHRGDNANQTGVNVSPDIPAQVKPDIPVQTKPHLPVQADTNATSSAEGVNNCGPVLNGKLTPTSYQALDMFLTGEAVALTGILGLRTIQEFGGVFQNCRLSLSAELGKPKEDVSFFDMFSSQNPMIKIECSRMIGKTLSRLGSSVPFAFGVPFINEENNGLRLLPGLVGSAFNIGMERTVFFKKTPYDIVVQAVVDVQTNGLSGEVVKDNLINSFQRALQTAYNTLGQNEIAKKDFDDLQPVFSQLANDIIDKKFGIESVISIIGGGTIVLGNPQRSIDNYLIVRDRMIEGIAEEAIAKKQANPHAELIEIVHRQGGELNIEDLATTARPGYVQMEYDRMQEKHFFNSGLSR